MERPMKRPRLRPSRARAPTPIKSRRSGQKVAARYSYLDDVFSGGDFFRLDPTEVHYVDNSTDGDEAFEALGVEWKRSSVD